MIDANCHERHARQPCIHARQLLRTAAYLVRSTVQHRLAELERRARGVLLNLLGNVLRQAQHKHVAVLVASCDRVKVERGARRHSSRYDVVGKDVELVLGALVLEEEERLARIADNDAIALCVDGLDERWDVLLRKRSGTRQPSSLSAVLQRATSARTLFSHLRNSLCLPMS